MKFLEERSIVYSFPCTHMWGKVAGESQDPHNHSIPKFQKQQSIIITAPSVLMTQGWNNYCDWNICKSNQLFQFYS